jgi:O-antigen/teichoic acid export membrane protein
MKKILLKLIKKGFFHIFGSNVINKIIQFGSSIFLVRLISKQDFGIFSYAQNILNIFMLFSGLGSTYALMQFGSQDQSVSKKNSYFRYSLKLGVLFNIVLSISLLMYGLYFTSQLKLKYTIILMIAMPIFMYCFEFIQIYFRTSLLNIEFSRLSTINTLLIFIFSVLGALYCSLFGIVAGMYLAYFISIIVGWFLLRVKTSFKIQKNILSQEEKKEFLSYSLLSMFNNVVSQVTYLVDLFLIGLLLKEATTLATYKAATLIPFALNFIPTSIMVFVYPYFVKKQNDLKWIKNKFKILQKYLLLFNFSITVLLLVISSFIFKILFGTQYMDSVFLFKILMIGYFISSSFRNPAGNVLSMMKKVKFLLSTNVIMGIINILLDIIMIKFFSVTGAALTNVIIIFLTSLIYNMYLYKILNEIDNWQN